jgi:hypothetical protein
MLHEHVFAGQAALPASLTGFQQLEDGLPKPRWSRRPRSERAEVADATVHGVLDLGVWGGLLAVPGVALWLRRRRRRARH